MKLILAKLIGALFFLCYLELSSTFAEPPTPKTYLEMIYEDKGGYTIPKEEAKAILKAGGHPQYGEIPYDSAAFLLDDLNLSRQDIFYDLGSGVGKLTLQVYLTTPVKRSIGIEVSPTRWKIAESRRKQLAKDDHLAITRDLVFLNQDIKTANFSDATVCFISGIAFPPPLIQLAMNRLSATDHNIKVISVLPLPSHKQFTLLKTYMLPMSWAPEGVETCLYAVAPASQNKASGKPNKRQKKGKTRAF